MNSLQHHTPNRERGNNIEFKDKTKKRRKKKKKKKKKKQTPHHLSTAQWLTKATNTNARTSHEDEDDVDEIAT